MLHSPPKVQSITAIRYVSPIWNRRWLPWHPHSNQCSCCCLQLPFVSVLGWRGAKEGWPWLGRVQSTRLWDTRRWKMGHSNNRSIQVTDSCFKACLHVMQITLGERGVANEPPLVSSPPYCVGRKLTMISTLNGCSQMKRMGPMWMASVLGRHTQVDSTISGPPSCLSVN